MKCLPTPGEILNIVLIFVPIDIYRTCKKLCKVPFENVLISPMYFMVEDVHNFSFIAI